MNQTAGQARPLHYLLALVYLPRSVVRPPATYFRPPQMNLLGSLFQSSIGRKFLMAITGLVLLGFVTGHLVGNLQFFLPPAKINAYAHLLESLGDRKSVV